MRQYLALLQQILDQGTRQANRTGVDAISIPGAMMRFDLADGFPAVTTRKVPYRSAIAETIGFLRGYESAADFRALGCKFWDQNANEDQRWLTNPNRRGQDDLGRIYGAQWRRWNATDGGQVDQVMSALRTIHERPADRRIVISAWRPDEFDRMALPPCHVLYQFIVNVERRELNLCMMQRSADSAIGVPANVIGSAFLLSLFAHLTGYAPRYFTHFLGDAHVYVNHVEQVREQLAREPLQLARLKFSDNIPAYREGEPFRPELVDAIEPADVELVGYESHAPLKLAMAV